MTNQETPPRTRPPSIPDVLERDKAGRFKVMWAANSRGVGIDDNP